MATKYVNSITYGGNEYKLVDSSSGYEANQNAFSNVKVGSDTIAADSKTDTLELVAGTGITLTPDATNDKVTIATNLTVPTKTSDLTNDSGFITGINSNDVTSALGYTPYNSTNPDGYITSSSLPNNYSSITVSKGTTIADISPDSSGASINIEAGSNINITTGTSNNVTISASVPSAGTTASAVGTTSSGGSATTYSKSDHVHNITSSTITSALGFTPTSNTGTVTKVTAGTGLNTTSNDTATDGGNFTTSGTLYLTKSGVTAGTYQGITVDKYGRVTSASNQGYTTNTGTVTSVRVQATSPVQSSTNTAQSSTLNTTISLADGYGDTKNPYGSKTAKYVLAAPNGSAGAPSFRALVASDIPALSYLSSSGGNVSGDITRSNYGTYRVSAWCYGTSTRSTNDNVTAGYYFYVPMNTTVSENPYLNVPTNTGTKLFSTANGGIKVNRAGKYKVSGAIYMGTGSSNGKAGAYIFDSTTSFSTAGTGVQTPPSTSTEVVGCPAYGAGTDIVCVIPPKIISLESGHIVHLVGRCMTQAGKIYYTNKATYLLVEWVGD